LQTTTLLVLQESYMHPNGQIPAYEWNFSDVNPPVHSWQSGMLRKKKKAERTGSDIILEKFQNS
jgi:hypothetical protein